MMKKKAFAWAAAACMALALAGCGEKGSQATEAATTEASTTAAAATEASTTAAVATEAATTGAAQGAAVEDSKAGGKLVMATNAEFPPYEYHEGGKIVGIDPEIAAAIAGKLGMKLEIQDMAFDSIIPAVQSGKADIGVAGMTVTDDRKQNVDFTDTYAQASQVVIVKEGSPIKTPADLAGKKIGVQLGTTGDSYADGIEKAEIERYNKGMEAVQALTQGKLDAVIIDREPAKEFVKANQGLQILDQAFTDEQYAMAVKKGNTDLLNKINGALKELKDSGEIKKIIDKYITAE